MVRYGSIMRRRKTSVQRDDYLAPLLVPIIIAAITVGIPALLAIVNKIVDKKVK